MQAHGYACLPLLIKATTVNKNKQQQSSMLGHSLARMPVAWILCIHVLFVLIYKHGCFTVSPGRLVGGWEKQSRATVGCFANRSKSHIKRQAPVESVLISCLVANQTCMQTGANNYSHLSILSSNSPRRFIEPQYVTTQWLSILRTEIHSLCLLLTYSVELCRNIDIELILFFFSSLQQVKKTNFRNKQAYSLILCDGGEECASTDVQAMEFSMLLLSKTDQISESLFPSM